MLTDRNKHTNVSEQGEVTEFLTQLNNCGANNILVIGATNKPEQIDQAALRAGRLEYKYYIGLPEYQARKQMFDICLKQSSISEDIDFNYLAKRTSNYISADIQLIIDNATRQAFREKSDKITMQILQQIIQTSKPTINLETITQYENLRDKFLIESSVNNKYKKIGY